MAKQKRNFVNDNGWGNIDLVWATTIICKFCNLNGIEWRFSNLRVVISEEGSIDVVGGQHGQEKV